MLGGTRTPSMTWMTPLLAVDVGRSDGHGLVQRDAVGQVDRDLFALDGGDRTSR